MRHSFARRRERVQVGGEGSPEAHLAQLAAGERHEDVLQRHGHHLDVVDGGALGACRVECGGDEVTGAAAGGW